MNIKICAYVHTSSNIKISYHFVAGSDKIDKKHISRLVARALK